MADSEKNDAKIFRSRKTAFKAQLQKKGWTRVEFARQLLRKGQPEEFAPDKKEVTRVAERVRYQVSQNKLTLPLCSAYAPVFDIQPSKLYIEYTSAEKADAGGTTPAASVHKAPADGNRKKGAKPNMPVPTALKAPALPSLTVTLNIPELGVSRTLTLTYAPDQLGFAGDGATLNGSMELRIAEVGDATQLLKLFVK